MKVNRVLRQISVFALIGTMIATDITPAYAYTYTNSKGAVNETQTVGSEDEDKSVSCDVYAELGSNFIVTIPKKITLSGSTKSGTYTVDVEGDIAGNEYIAVIPDASFALSSANLASVTALINQDKINWTYDEILAGNKVAGTGSIGASGITAGSWNGSFNFNVKLAVQRFDITAVDESGTNLNATGSYILGSQKTALISKLIEAGFIESENEVATLIDVQSDEFTGKATTTFDVSSVASTGDIVTFYHYDEADGWECIGTAVVSENGTATGTFNSFSPVAISVGRSETHTHSYDAGVITKEATCTEDGVKTFTCYCGDSYTEAISATGHSYGEWETVTSPNCTDKGSEKRECATCSFTESRDLNALGHSWEDDYTIDKAATCTENGSKSIHCAKCDATKDSTVIPAAGHNYGSVTYSWAEDNSTCAASRSCSKCSNVESEKVNSTNAITTAETCTTDGVRTYTAKFTNSAFATQTTTDAILATGHIHKVSSASAYCTKENTKVSVSDSCIVVSVNTTCTKCGKTFSGSKTESGVSLFKMSSGTATFLNNKFHIAGYSYYYGRYMNQIGVDIYYSGSFSSYRGNVIISLK